MQRILKFLSPPVFEDLQKAREAKYAHYFSIILIFAYLYALVHELVSGTSSYLILLYISIFFTFLFSYLNKNKLIQKPLLFIEIIMLSSAASIMYFVDGTRDEITLALPIVLVISSLAFDRRVLVITLAVELFILWIIGFLEIESLVKGRFSWGTSFFQLTVQSIILLGSAFIIDLIVGDKKKIITELFAKSEEIANVNKELKKSSATKDKFFSIIAHDLRSPFQGLLGIASILENLDDDLTPEERKDFATRLNTALKRQYDFLEELLLWGKFQRNVVDYEPLVCDLKDIVERNCEILSENICRKKLHLNVDCPKEVNTCCDENLISTVIRNLVSNAIKYTPAGGSIRVKVEELPDNISVSVIDNGIGISETRRRGLFNIESHSSTRGTEDEAGTGLGLILCKEIMDRHSGKIMTLSEEGKGSTFKIELPKTL